MIQIRNPLAVPLFSVSVSLPSGSGYGTSRTSLQEAIAEGLRHARFLLSNDANRPHATVEIAAICPHCNGTGWVYRSPEKSRRCPQRVLFSGDDHSLPLVRLTLHQGGHIDAGHPGKLEPIKFPMLTPSERTVDAEIKRPGCAFDHRHGPCVTCDHQDGIESGRGTGGES